jgi:multisubunit Na+/H+ antiporter MnhB subunit
LRWVGLAHSEEVLVRLTPPAQLTWIIALIVGSLGILVRVGALRLPGLGLDSFWLVAVAFLLLLVAPLAKGL